MCVLNLLLEQTLKQSAMCLLPIQNFSIIFQGNKGSVGESAIYIDDINDCCWERNESACKSSVFTQFESQWPFIYL